MSEFMYRKIYLFNPIIYMLFVCVFGFILILCKQKQNDFFLSKQHYLQIIFLNVLVFIGPYISR